eukprot:1159740-Pelagomonas_calceolata.AAC.5
MPMCLAHAGAAPASSALPAGAKDATPCTLQPNPCAHASLQPRACAPCTRMVYGVWPCSPILGALPVAAKRTQSATPNAATSHPRTLLL